MEVGEIQGFAEYATTDDEHVGGRIDFANPAPDPFERGHRVDQAGKLDGGQHRAEHGEEHGGNLAAGDGRGEEPHRGGNAGKDQGRCRQGQEATADRHVKHGDRRQTHQQEIEHRHAHVGQHLADQELGAAGRRDVEVDDRAQLFFAHHGQRREHGRKHQEEQRHHRRHHRWQASDIRVVAVARFHVGRAGQGDTGPFAQKIDKPLLVHALHVALDRFGPLRHRPVDPGGDLRCLAAFDIAGKTGRDFNRQRDFAAAHAPVEVVVIKDGQTLGEIARTGEVQGEVLR